MLVSDFTIRIYFHALSIHLGGSNYCNNVWGLQYCKSEFIHWFCINNVSYGSLTKRSSEVFFSIIIFCAQRKYLNANHFLLHKENIWMLKFNKLISFKFRYLISSCPSFLREKSTFNRVTSLSFPDMDFELTRQFQPNLLRGKVSKNLKTLT